MDEKKVQLVIGKRGSGKSVLAQHLIGDAERLVVFDIMSEYGNGVTFDSEDIPCLVAFWRQVYKGSFRIVYRPIDPKVEIEWLAEAVYVLGDLTFVVEEIDSVCTPYDVPWAMRQVIQRGRHKNIQLIGVTPAPFGIHRDLTRQAKDLFIFSTNEPRDIQYLRGLLGEKIEPALAGLGKYEFVHWTQESEILRIGIVYNGQITYRDKEGNKEENKKADRDAGRDAARDAEERIQSVPGDGEH